VLVVACSCGEVPFPVIHKMPRIGGAKRCHGMSSARCPLPKKPTSNQTHMRTRRAAHSKTNSMLFKKSLASKAKDEDKTEERTTRKPPISRSAIPVSFQGRELEIDRCNGLAQNTETRAAQTSLGCQCQLTSSAQKDDQTRSLNLSIGHWRWKFTAINPSKGDPNRSGGSANPNEPELLSRLAATTF